MTTLSRLAPAKLNLTLAVVGRRPDGYHLLESLIAFAEYGDTVTVETAPDLRLSIDGPFAASLDGANDDNLVLRAARRLAAAAGRAPQAAITLTKRLPVASGIGGGSSDAAAALLALAELWDLKLTAAELADIGLALGADVPVCLAGHPAWLEGIGEQVTPAPPLPRVPIVLVNPGIGLATPGVFKARTGAFSRAGGFGQIQVDDAVSLAHALIDHGNDLTDAAIGLLPQIRDILAALAATPHCLLARMSGSGATCFGLFPDDPSAMSAAEHLKHDRPDWWVVATALQTG